MWRNSGGFGYSNAATISNYRLRQGERRVSPVLPPVTGNRTTQTSAMAQAWEAKASLIGMEWLKVVNTYQGDDDFLEQTVRVDFGAANSMDTVFAAAASKCHRATSKFHV